jgi:hypothetical protein
MSEDLAAAVRTLQQQVRRLQDEQEIREIIARYAYHVTHGGHADAIADLFTEDGVFDTRTADGSASNIFVKGKAELALFYSSVPKNINPMIHDLLLDLRGDEASGACVLDNPCYNGQRPSYLGHYKDEFRRVDGKWRFKARVFFPLQGGIPKT